jgi:hypothetical protein
MTVTSGFFNSLSGDRKYDAVQLGAIFDGLISDGIYASYGDAFVVSENSDMDITIGSGRCWFDGTWTYNDTDYVLTVDDAEVVLDRIDVVVIEVDTSEANRINTIKIVKGTPSSDPVAPTLTTGEEVNQYPLAHILVEAGVTEITASEITNKIGVTGGTPFVTGIVDTVDTTTLLAQWNAEFDAWFDEMKDQLSVDAAGNLQLQIDDIEDDIDLLQEAIDGMGGGAGFPILINGGFNVWQRGTVFSGVSHGDFGPDRWKALTENNTGVYSILQDTGVPGDSFSQYCMRFYIATGITSVPVNADVGFMYKIEGYDYANLKDTEVVLSFWVKAPKAGVYCVSFRNGSYDRSYVCEYEVAAADTWEKHYVTLTLDQTGGTENYTNGTGLAITFVLACGSNYQTTKDTWQTGSYLATSSQVNGCDTDGSNFYIADVQLDSGDTPQDFMYQNEWDDLRRGLRYCEVLSHARDGYWMPNMSAGAFTQSTQFIAGMWFHRKRAIPTFSYSAAGDFAIRMGNNLKYPSSITFSNPSRVSCLCDFTTSGGSAGYCGMVRSNNANRVLTIDAEL